VAVEGVFAPQPVAVEGVLAPHSVAVEGVFVPQLRLRVCPCPGLAPREYARRRDRAAVIVPQCIQLKLAFVSGPDAREVSRPAQSERRGEESDAARRTRAAPAPH
jgi:hypothetical protein